MSAELLPSRITDHRPNTAWTCTTCIGERWPCRKLTLVALAYFWHNPRDLFTFMRSYYERAVADPQFRSATAGALHDRFIGWIEPTLAAHRHAQRAWAAVNTGARSVLADMVTRFRAVRRDTGNAGPVMGQPPLPRRGNVRFGEVRDRVAAGRRA